jgi:nucleotide-binding universal stress UspA family protein
MYKRILAAVDGSDTSELALREAVGLARDQQALLRIVYVVDEATIFAAAEFVSPVEIEKAWVESGRAALSTAKSFAQAAGIEAETKLLENEALGWRIADVIVQEAKSWPADLLVIGTHGRSGLDHLLLGSVAEGIVRMSPVPVLLVRGK